MSSPIRSSSAAARCAAAIPGRYLRHLFKAEEMLAMRLAVTHNLYFYNSLMQRIRDSLDAGELDRLQRNKFTGNSR